MTNRKVFWKDLTKKERKHCHQNGITTLREFKVAAEHQKKHRDEALTQGRFDEPCWECRRIAVKLGLSV